MGFFPQSGLGGSVSSQSGFLCDCEAARKAQNLPLLSIQISIVFFLICASVIEGKNDHADL